jgi:glycosyl transferase family 87
VTSTGLARAARRIRPLFLFVLLPLLVALLRLDSLHDRFATQGYDFRGTLWEPARQLLEGASPYPSATDAASLASGNPSVYPPLPIELATPLARLGFDAAFACWLVLLVAAVVAALWLVGVRDWRCYSLALLSPPVVEGLFFGNVTLLLVLLLACAWRWRARWAPSGFAVAAAVAVKPLLVPLVLWLLLTRRFRAAALSVVATVALVLVPWAVIGFDGLRQYPRLLDRLDDVYGPGTDSLPVALSWLGASETARRLVCLVAAAVLVALAYRVRTRRNGDLAVFAAMVGVSVVATPIVWPHYLALLLVPLAIRYPRPTLAWVLPYALPLVLAIDPRQLRAVAFVLLACAMIRVALRPGLVTPRPAGAPERD